MTYNRRVDIAAALIALAMLAVAFATERPSPSAQDVDTVREGLEQDLHRRPTGPEIADFFRSHPQ